MLQRSTILRNCNHLRLYRAAHSSTRRPQRPSAKSQLIGTFSSRLPPESLQRIFDEMSDSRPLDFEAGPLVWIDLEMSGLNLKKDKILEIAVLITNGDLEVVDEGLQYIIRAEKSLLNGMDEWCTKQHGMSGLTKACLESPYTTEYVAKSVLEYIKKWVSKPRIAVLAGNSVHVDRNFLAAEMPEIIDWLHYRIVDVSSIKELARRWYPDNQAPRPAAISHRALDDIRGSIDELKWYRANLFVPP